MLRSFGHTLRVGALALGLSTSAVSAQGISDTPEELAAFAFGLCVLQGTSDLDGQLARIAERAEAAGLPKGYADEKQASFGSYDAINVTISKTIDSLTCQVNFAPDIGTVEAYPVIEAPFAAWVASQPYEKVITSDDDDPSPHIDGYSWVIYTAGKDIIVYNLIFGTEKGVLVFANVRKNYE